MCLCNKAGFGRAAGKGAVHRNCCCRRRRALKCLHETNGRNPVVDEGYVIAGAAGPIFAQLWLHGEGWNVRSAPGSDITHDTAIRRSVVRGAVGIGAKTFTWNSEEYKRKFWRVAGVFAAVSPPGMSVFSIAMTCGDWK